jgi:hypothetical protein
MSPCDACGHITTPEDEFPRHSSMCPLAGALAEVERLREALRHLIGLAIMSLLDLGADQSAEALRTATREALGEHA